jgi:nitrite reductase (NADH) small subunit
MARIVTVARVGEIPDGEARTVGGPAKAVSVFRDGDRYFAIDDMCPHMGASLAGGFVEDGIVTCPWHYWRFRLSDGAWADNPRIKIGCYPVHVVEGEIRVELPDPAEAKS